MSRFDYLKYDERANELQAEAKETCQKLERMISGLGHNGDSVSMDPQLGRSKALAVTKLEEFYMWMGKAIRDEQIVRSSSVELQEEQKDG